MAWLLNRIDGEEDQAVDKNYDMQDTEGNKKHIVWWRARGELLIRLYWFQDIQAEDPYQLARLVSRDRLHRENMDFLSLSTALHSCQNILSEKKQWTFLWCQEVLLSPMDKLSSVVANYPVIKL